MVRLPSEYQEVEYIKGTGTQWIDTGVIIQNGYGFEVEAKFESNTVSWDDGTIRYICGSRTNYTSNRFTIQSQSSAGGMRVETDSASRYEINTGVIPTERHVYQVSNNGIFVDGNLNSSTVLVTGNSLHFLIFNISNNGSNIPTSSAAGVGARFWRGPVYYLKLFETNSGETLHHYIPCYRKSDNKPGMYDLVSGQFFTNAGTGEFIVGGEVRHESVEMLHLRRRLLDFGRYVSPHLGEASGNPMTFNTDIARNLHKLVIPFEPVQEGTGDPSPDNVRPISGWTGVDIEQRGKNLFDISSPVGFYNQGGRVYAETFTTDGLELKFDAVDSNKGLYLFMGKVQAQPYTISCTGMSRTSWRIAFCENPFIAGDTSPTITWLAKNISGSKLSQTVTPPSEGYLYMSWYAVSGQCTVTGVQFSVGDDSDTSYEAYRAASIPITFTDPSTGDPLTVYGGELTINEDGSADLVDMYMCRSIGSMSSISAPSSTAAEPWSHRWLARHWRSGPNATWEAGSSWIMTTELAAGDARRNGTYETSIGYLYDNTITTVAEFREKYKDVFACYKLKNQFYNTYHFDNIGQLKTLIGENVIWSDTNGINTAEYWTHLN